MTTWVPAEFLGLGRRFREQIADADDRATRTMIHIFTPLAQRADRSAIPRVELLQGAARQWRQEMPSVGLLDSKIQLSRRDLHIREVRIGGGTGKAPWDEAAKEPVIYIVLVDLHVARGICRMMVDATALLSLHALGRWYQRSLDNSDAALLADLARLAGACGQILESHAATGDRTFYWPAPSGQWAGSITRYLSEVTGRQERILNIRTFLAGSAKRHADRQLCSSRTTPQQPPADAP